MIKITKVDSLKKDREEVLFRDLSNGDAFVFKEIPPELKVRMSPLSFYSFDSCCFVPQADGDEAIIPVNAEIRWAYRDGEGASQ